MAYNILITGASGYLGGTLLARWAEAKLTGYTKLFALVRTDAQAEAVRKYGAEPLSFSSNDEDAVREAVVKHQITIVYWLIDAMSSTGQVNYIKALAEVKRLTGKEVHLLHTTGTKQFSSHAGAPTEKPLLDTDPELYNIQKGQTAPIAIMQRSVEASNTVIEQAEAHGARSYIFAPCIVYGRGEGFGNQISIQTVAIVKAAREAGRVYSVTAGQPAWPVCHIIDTTTLYLQILRSILNNENPGHGKNGYYLASSGSVQWNDLYRAMAKALLKRGVVPTDEVIPADENSLKAMAKGLDGDLSLVEMHLAGNMA
ncbi:hypothetical protein C8034_v001041 [Colletotrichum sidae]|uniref:NAD-dependent epimerase/dehydratase domain-containing protein n=1 Tax=Colletotrichum sidae TaxID=1347389 RepID=A0A4V3I2S9_9PEZI|nr:hypothetical protein C8034_v001041 [Colletotrichum sidae]